jgi:hypothetical protein
MYQDKTFLAYLLQNSGNAMKIIAIIIKLALISWEGLTYTGNNPLYGFTKDMMSVRTP